MPVLLRSDRKISLLETDHWTELASLPGPILLTRMVFSTDDTQLAVGNEAGLVEIWDLRKIRRELAAIGLDFPLPPLPPETNAPPEKPWRWVLVTNQPPRIVLPAH